MLNPDPISPPDRSDVARGARALFLPTGKRSKAAVPVSEDGHDSPEEKRAVQYLSQFAQHTSRRAGKLLEAPAECRLFQENVSAVTVMAWAKPFGKPGFAVVVNPTESFWFETEQAPADPFEVITMSSGKRTPVRPNGAATQWDAFTVAGIVREVFAPRFPELAQK